MKIQAILISALTLLVFCLSGCGGSGNSSSNNQATAAQMGGAIQGKSLTLSGTTSTLAGQPLLALDGAGASAMFNGPYGITSDGTNMYVTDYNDHLIRKIVIATGVVSTLAGGGPFSSGSVDAVGTAAKFNYPYGITTDGANLYVADSNNHTIRKIVIATGLVSTLAGSAGVSGSTDSVDGTSARFNYPCGITTDGINLYVADSSNNTIRKIVIASGAVTTLAGSSGVRGSIDGTGSVARFWIPTGITTDMTNLYVVDYANNTIRKVVIATGAVTTLAGTAGVSGSIDDIGTKATFNYLQGISNDGTNLYVTDTNNHTIRQVVIATGLVSTLAGSAGKSGSTDGIGNAARFNFPRGIAIVGTNLYVADTVSNTIRKMATSTSTVTTLAGSLLASSGSIDVTGSASRFNDPDNITTDGTNLYIADTMNHTIRKMVIATGAVTTMAGSAGVSGSTDATGPDARFYWPHGITTDGSNLYVTDSNNSTIRKIVISSGVVTTLAGTAGASGSLDAVGTAARFNYPHGITTDGANLYITDSHNHTLRQVVIATGVVTTLAGRVGVSGSTDATGSAARFNYPQGITTDGTNLYLTDTNNNTIRKMVIATGVVTTLAGNTGVSGSTDAVASAALFNYPHGITTDGINLYVADSSNNTIRKIVIASGAVTTLAGDSGVNGSNDGTGTAAGLYWPSGITTDGTKLYFTDSSNNTIRSIH